MGAIVVIDCFHKYFLEAYLMIHGETESSEEFMILFSNSSNSHINSRYLSEMDKVFYVWLKYFEKKPETNDSSTLFSTLSHVRSNIDDIKFDMIHTLSYM